MSFGSWIRQRRRSMDLTQEQLAEKVACSPSAIRKIEADERRPSREVAALLADALEIPENNRALFLRIARSEVRYERLAEISTARPITLAMESLLPSLHPVAPMAPVRARPSSAAPRLPTYPTPLVGRSAELSQIVHLLSDPACRLLTLAGAGGIGKTRLAVAAAERLTGAFADGVYFAPLTTVEGPALLPSAIAQAMNIHLHGSGDPMQQLFASLQAKRALLVVDSVEHLLDGGDVLLSQLLQRAGGVKILATSREQLSLQGEWVFFVQGLPVAASEEGWDESSAMNLFVQSARRALIGFAPSPEERIAIARICLLVDGIPLAIELAASWVRTLTCQEIAAEIERDWAFLTGVLRDMPERHRSLKAVFDQSWALLSQEERRVMSRLSVFRGSFRRELAARVADAAISHLSSLTAKSLLSRAGEGRFELHDLVRQYAAEQLATSGDEQIVRQRHAVAFLALAEEAALELHRQKQIEWLDRLDREHDNIRAALRWMSEFDPVGGLRLSSAIWWFSFMRGHWRECREWLATFLAKTTDQVSAARAGALARAANMAWLYGDSAQALRQAAEAQEMAAAVGDDANLSLALYVEGQTTIHHDMAHSNDCFLRSLAVSRSIGDGWGEGRALYRLGLNAYVADDLPTARAYFDEGLAVFRAVGDKWGVYAILSDMGGLARRMGDLETAQQLGEECLRLCRELGFRQGLAMEMLGLGVNAWGSGNFDQARQWLRESLRIFSELDNQRGVADVYFHLGNTARWQGDYAAAQQHYELALILSRASDFAPAVVIILRGLAEVKRLQRDHIQALALANEALTIERRQTGLHFGLPNILETFAALAQEMGQLVSAARILGAADRLRGEYSVAPMPVEAANHTEFCQNLRDALGESDSHLEWTTGRNLSLDDVLALCTTLNA